MNTQHQNWHKTHKETQTFGEKASDKVSAFVGSWKFLIIQTSIIILWILWNILPFLPHFDPYPFILLTLALSLQAAYAAPIIMMSQNRQSERDRIQANADYETNITAKQEIEALQIKIEQIEVEKLDKILEILKKLEQK